LVPLTSRKLFGQISISTEQIILPPQLPPRNISGNESKDCHSDSSRGTDRGTELARPSISDTYLQRLQQIDISK